MKKSTRKVLQQRRRSPTLRILRAVKWVAIATGIVLIVYALSQTAGVAFDEADIRVVDFSSLTSGARRSTLREVNRMRCTCGCGMTLAQCVATDMTCPIRDQNIETIRSKVREARSS